MEIRKDSLSSVKLCRFCLSQDSQDLQSLYDRSGGRPRNNASLAMKILSAMAIEVFPSDKMPSYICKRCNYFMDMCYEYKQIVRQADESILHYVQTGSSMKAIAWPAVLTKAHQLAKPGMGVVKTVVEGGATVEVSSQDMSDEDGEDDENVYKVKIGDGKEEARIKVITSDESKKPKKGSEVLSSDADSPRAVPRGPSGGPGRWSCDECDHTYPLQQLLELHKTQQHRARPVTCDQCDAQFFSKYHLAVHQVRHSNETPYECDFCDCKFKRFGLLQKHGREAHADVPRLKCPVTGCKASFVSPEDWKAHSSRHSQGFPCDQCGKKFYERSTLHRHKKTMHTSMGKSWSCEHCPERFTSATKLTRHVRTHAGERPYPCKYCDKSFTKSHHYTRHVRVKHAALVGTQSLQCEQCGMEYASQDELMYHSAIHATQDLTCPLCHEKFDNVDGVTTHIKSHVSGMEFMCEYCELVFTTKLKLDAHTASAHEDEMHNEQSLGQDESSMEAEEQEEDEDEEFKVKEEGDHMVVEIKKPESFILSDSKGEIDYRETDNTCSEDSETDTTYPEMATLNVVPSPAAVNASPVKPPLEPKPTLMADKPNENRTAAIVRKAEEMKKKLQQKQAATITNVVPAKKEEKPVAKVEPNNSVGNDKSLKLLEKELQELQRTKARQEAANTAAKPAEPARNNRRPQLNTSTSTPKVSKPNEKKPVATPKTPVEKKVPERRAIKENKEPKEAKTPVSAKDEKEKVNNTSVKEDKDTKEKETPKSAVKNGANDKGAEEVRRSTRPSKVKDYAKMAQQRNKDESENDDSDYGDDEEYVSEDARPKSRRSTAAKPQPKTPVAVKPTPKKRGRPRKDQSVEVPAKVSKQSNQQEEEEKCEKEDNEESQKDLAPVQKETAITENQTNSVNKDTVQASPEIKPDVMKSPSGQTLKKVPIKSLPPGIKPLPLPSNIRPMTTGSISEMQIGKKMVKVQKIVMTKAEVEAMAKKGLLEMKDGTMVLKQGIKLPTSDPNSIKSTLVGEESPSRKVEKSTPTRCDIEENA